MAQTEHVVCPALLPAVWHVSLQYATVSSMGTMPVFLVAIIALLSFSMSFAQLSHLATDFLNAFKQSYRTDTAQLLATV